MINTKIFLKETSHLPFVCEFSVKWLWVLNLLWTSIVMWTAGVMWTTGVMCPVQINAFFCHAIHHIFIKMMLSLSGVASSLFLPFQRLCVVLWKWTTLFCILHFVNTICTNECRVNIVNTSTAIHYTYRYSFSHAILRYFWGYLDSPVALVER